MALKVSHVLLHPKAEGPRLVDFFIANGQTMCEAGSDGYITMMRFSSFEKRNSLIDPKIIIPLKAPIEIPEEHCLFLDESNKLHVVDLKVYYNIVLKKGYITQSGIQLK